MPNKTSDLAKSIIRDYIDNQAHIASHEAISSRFTAQVHYEDLAIIDAIASYFQDTRTNLVGEILHNMAMELFMSLPSHERHQCADIAQELIAKHEEKNNFTSNGGNKWAFIAKEMDKNA